MPLNAHSGKSGTSTKMMPQACSHSVSASRMFARCVASRASAVIGSKPDCAGVSASP